jgi:hypothetical protein
MLEKLSPLVFDWQAWRANDFFNEFGVPIRHSEHFSETIRKHAIGYCNGESLVCRPKANTKAVMFWDGNNNWWTHFTNSEFDRIFTPIISQICPA